MKRKWTKQSLKKALFSVGGRALALLLCLCSALSFCLPANAVDVPLISAPRHRIECPNVRFVYQNSYQAGKSDCSSFIFAPGTVQRPGFQNPYSDIQDGDYVSIDLTVIDYRNQNGNDWNGYKFEGYDSGNLGSFGGAVISFEQIYSYESYDFRSNVYRIVFQFTGTPSQNTWYYMGLKFTNSNTTATPTSSYFRLNNAVFYPGQYSLQSIQYWLNQNTSVLNSLNSNISSVITELRSQSTTLGNIESLVRSIQSTSSVAGVIAQQQATNQKLDTVNTNLQNLQQATEEQTQQQEEQYEQEKQEEAEREEAGQDAAEQGANIFTFTLMNPFAGIFNLFSGSGCVAIPTIGGMMNKPDATYCPWFSQSIRNILTPVIGLSSSMLLFGFIIRWLSTTDGVAISEDDYYKSIARRKY